MASEVEDGKKGGLVVFDPLAEGGNLGAGENPLSEYVFSISNILASDSACNHGGGTMFARRWRLRSNASHTGMLLLCGGWRVGVEP